jgi:hypothetical protein
MSARRRARSRASAAQRAAQRARTETAVRARETAPKTMPHPLPLLLVGGLLAAAAIAVLTVMIAVALRGGSIDEVFPTLARRVPSASIPASLLLFAGCALFLGEMFRRARWEFRQITLRTAGMTTIRTRSLPLWLVWAWSFVAVAAWVLLVLVPVLFVRAGSDPSTDLWLISLIYGFIAAGTWGVFVVSIVKRLAYSRAHSSTAGARELRFWRIASVQWRIESWFGFLAAGLAGVLPLSLASVRTSTPPVDPDAVGLLVIIALALAIVALGLAVASPRSGYAEGVAESVI